MRLLHTSDWHVGKSIRGASRADEHRAVLGEIASIAQSEDVNLVIVAGDLFDSASPSPESEEIVYQALLELAASGVQIAQRKIGNIQRRIGLCQALEVFFRSLVATRSDAAMARAVPALMRVPM